MRNHLVRRILKLATIFFHYWRHLPKMRPASQEGSRQLITTSDLKFSNMFDRRKRPLSRNYFKWITSPLLPRKHPKFAKILIFMRENGTFSFAQLFTVVTRTGLELRSGCFLGQKLGFWPKNPFLLLDPGFGKWPVFGPRKDGPFPTFRSIFQSWPECKGDPI